MIKPLIVSLGVLTVLWLTPLTPIHGAQSTATLRVTGATDKVAPVAAPVGPVVLPARPRQPLPATGDRPFNRGWGLALVGLTLVGGVHRVRRRADD
ncbi:hypothetical protein [Lacticaseibacillus daqingensis]|uniref:hypothetical protein n=1 Tax=Lacticaseibacillus daqingensis TaxID=2486014 RepID=UPI000F7A5AAC|nr:hypothetical protein [Lacticaseibacillus daqingensis]